MRKSLRNWRNKIERRQIVQGRWLSIIAEVFLPVPHLSYFCFFFFFSFSFSFLLSFPYQNKIQTLTALREQEGERRPALPPPSLSLSSLLLLVLSSFSFSLPSCSLFLLVLLLPSSSFSLLPSLLPPLSSALTLHNKVVETRQTKFRHAQHCVKEKGDRCYFNLFGPCEGGRWSCGGTDDGCEVYFVDTLPEWNDSLYV
jgi:hypothetical protein